MAQAKIAGGTAVVSSGIQSFLTTRFGASHVKRFAGTDRYDTSVLISRDAFTSSSSAYLATGANFPDALAGAATAGRQGSPLITVRGSCISQEDGDELDRLGMSTAHLLGGVGALGQTVGVLRLC
jgi:putative cell wall-binding protein